MFSSKGFTAFALLFRSLIHFEVTFACDVKQGGIQLNSFACGYPIVPEPFVEKTILALLNCFGILVENQLTVNVKVYFQTLNSIPLIYR